MRTLKELKKLAKNEMADPMFKMALLGDTATQLLAVALQGESVARGLAMELYEAEYNQVERLLLDSTSELYQYDADIIVIFQSTHKLAEHHSLLTQEQQATMADDRLSFVSTICENPVSSGKRIIYFNYLEIEDTVFGSYANKAL